MTTCTLSFTDLDMIGQSMVVAWQATSILTLGIFVLCCLAGYAMGWTAGKGKS